MQENNTSQDDSQVLNVIKAYQKEVNSQSEETIEAVLRPKSSEKIVQQKPQKQNVANALGGQTMHQPEGHRE